jgi:glucose/mannose transport system permease protein
MSRSTRIALSRLVPRLVIAPSFALSFLFIYGLMLWNVYLSLSTSRMMPNYAFAGLIQYERLFDSDRFWVALSNLGIFGVLYVGGSIVLGLFLAILLDQKIRAEGVLRTIYLYPMAISFIVTGTVWKWLLNPTLGVEHLLKSWGIEGVAFDWLVRSDKAIYCVVIAGIWQSAGFVMALFLAGLRSIDDAVIEAARVDGASTPRIYWSVILPGLTPVFFSTLMVVSHLAIKSFDLVMALTAGGPGYATDLPATFMYATAFSRGQIGVGAASATVILMLVAAIVVPYLYSELREQR